MKDNLFLGWILLISTFLIAGKAIGVLQIEWVYAFAPLILIVFSVVIAIIAAVAIASKNINKDGESK